MLRTGIEQFVGFSVSESGYRLRVRKVRKDHAFVDFLDPRGTFIARPYMGGAPSMKMVARRFEPAEITLQQTTRKPCRPLSFGLIEKLSLA